ncbi:conserved hypothetical Ustilaginaceae-specific protein [Sporisorium reilianum SRZ2]|uniref:Conserved hypothetical Ustilaginaceae-specific protein n=1 Tax=Sporisorium reilianum (strain SRZ2) TaxID=999809 RepID=E7A0A0_SPORE|nr:conserved hypothetical Ustilaginaceae-specific protein [Sporisorium reilianum SRZ2]
MRCFRAISTVAAFLLFGVAAQIPPIIQRSGHPIQWLYEEVNRGAFHYDASRDWPQIERTWPEFLRRRGEQIINDFYQGRQGSSILTFACILVTVEHSHGWYNNDRLATPLAIGADRDVARQAALHLVERFAEEQARAQEAVLSPAVSDAESSTGRH